jgi:APA family basic amino acid/polyamine antiporter
MNQPTNPNGLVKKELGLFDAISIIVGIVIGAGIFETAPFILGNVSSPWIGLSVWAAGGLLSLIGALCYAELATTYPREGGDYVYLSRAFGRWLGFLFGWGQLAVVLTASIGSMAYVFADYAVKLFPPAGADPASQTSGYAFLYASAAVIVLSALNILGVMVGKAAQNFFTAAKVLGLGGILVAGFFWGQGASALAVAPDHAKAVFADGGSTAWGLVMILVLFTYGGWNDAAFVAAEVRNPKRNIPRALIFGTLGITAIYLLVNAAYIMGLGFSSAQQSQGIAADVLRLPLGDFGHKAMCLLVMVSALGAVNGLIFTGSRVYWKLGSENSVFAALGRWHPRLGAPHWSLLAQAMICLSMIFVVGSETGRDAVNGLLTRLGADAIQWSGHGGFGILVTCSAPIFWAFFLLTGLSLFVLRVKDRHLTRPFTVPLYPVVPLIFCGMCGYMFYSAVTYAHSQFHGFGYFPWVLLGLGVPLYFLSRQPQQAAAAPDAEGTPEAEPEGVGA